MTKLKLFLVLFFLQWIISSTNGQGLSVTSLPAVLFDGGSETIVQGSVILLYCQVNSTDATLTVTWNKDSVPVVEDIVHIRTRFFTSASSSTYLLVVDNFQSSDSGMYQCTAQEGGGSLATGTSLTLTASPITDGSLQSSTIMDNADIGSNFIVFDIGILNRNRTGLPLNDLVTLPYQISHVGDNATSYSTPAVMWLKDGEPFRTAPSNTPGSNGRLDTTLSFTMTASDDGVYQCVINDMTRSETFATVPIRLEIMASTVMYTLPMSLDDTTIILRPPEQLVIQTRATGGYEFNEFRRNNLILTDSQFFYGFGETYLVESTTASDLGVYTVQLVTFPGQSFPSGEIRFLVVEPVSASTTSTSGSVVVVEGASVDITCTSTGIPVPTINWTLNNQTTPFNDSETVTDLMVGSIPETGVAPPVTLGSVMSTLHIENAQYPAHDGVYECIGTNSPAGVNYTSSAMVTVQVQVVPEVTVTADRTRVGLGGQATLTCSVTRANPMATTFTWTNLNTATQLAETSNTLTLTSITMADQATYRCEATNTAGTGVNIITIEVGMVPSVTVRVSPSSFVLMGTIVELACEATAGDTPITFSWTDSSGNAVSPGDTDGTVSVSVSSAEDYDTYTCTASNEFGVGTSEVEVMQAFAADIIRGPDNTTVTAPNTASFSCTSLGLPRPTITWLDPSSSRLVSGMGEVTIMEVQEGDRELVSTLNLATTAVSVAGEYTCETSNGVTGRGEVTTTAATLQVYVTPEVTCAYPDIAQLNYTVNMGNSVTFQCVATGIPAPVITWFRNGIELSNIVNSRVTRGDHSIVLMDDGIIFEVTRTLTLSMSEDGDSGVYECRASNDATPGLDTEQFEVIVQIPPYVIYATPSLRVLANVSESAVLSFRIENAVPAVLTSDIRWYYTTSTTSGQPNFDSSDFQEITNLASRTSSSRLAYSTDSLTLTVNNIVQALMAGEETDAGRYYLRASNPAGEGSSFIDLVVRGPPQIVGGPRSQFVVNNGSSAVFECEAIADPYHSVSWSFTDSTGQNSRAITVTSDLSSSKYNINRNESSPMFGALTVNDVMFVDRGTYTCAATNDLGERTAQANLTVHVIPVISSILEPNQTLLSNPATILCLATGYPVPIITWQRNATDLSDRDARISVSTFRSYSINFTSLSGRGATMFPGLTEEQITSLGELGVVGMLRIAGVVRDDGENYTCTARNQLPQTTLITATSDPVAMIVLERPDPPEGVTTFNHGARWIAVRWTPTFDGNRPVLRFMLYIRNVGEDFILVENLTASDLMTSGSSFTFNVSREGVVLPFTRYSFRVESCNEIGCSDQSQASSDVQTLQDMIMFQIRLVDVVNCEDWISDNPVSKAADVVQIVVAELRKRCQCDFRAEFITNVGFRCFPQSPTAVTFRALMTGSSQTTTQELVIFLEDWISSGAFLTIQAQLLSADRTCAVTISSLGGSECNSEMSPDSPSGVSSTVIGLVAGVAVFAVLLLGIVILCVSVAAWRRKKTQSFKPPLPLQSQDPIIYLNELAHGTAGEVQEETGHEYDRISIMGAETGESPYSEVKTIFVHTPPADAQHTKIELTPCPAYHVVKTTASAEVKINSEYDFPVFVGDKKAFTD